ncbi:toxin co-regulated pilus biosynthesis Q family protein [Pseudomonas aeruginosa]|nr:toxin co-regulated pilus biosynthesis Q family protein [Pseudomonas aeruginosa]
MATPLLLPRLWHRSALGFRREVHAAHSGRGFRPSGQGAHAGGAEPAVGTVLVSRDGINPARHLEAWAKRARWTVRWEPQDLNYPIEAPLSFHGSFEDAVSELFPLYDAAERPFLVNASRPQSLIIIKERKN